MARVLTVGLDDGQKFKLEIADDSSFGPSTEGWFRIKGSDGQYVLFHQTRLAYAHSWPKST